MKCYRNINITSKTLEKKMLLLFIIIMVHAKILTIKADILKTHIFLQHFSAKTV